MKNNPYLLLSLIAVAILSGCNSVPQNVALREAHSNYNSASSNPQVTNLAAPELRLAGDALKMADTASNNGDGAVTVNQLANLASQKIGIARETARLKAGQLSVPSADPERDQALIKASAAETDAANHRVAVMQKTVGQQAAALKTARANAVHDKSLIVAITEEADSAEQQAELVGKVADQQAIVLEGVDAREVHNQALIAQQQKELNDLKGRNTDRGLVITLGDILFDTNKSDLNPDGAHNLQKLADFLKQYPKYKVLVEGYTDSTGSDSLNQALSVQRANAVRNALIEKGIDADRVTTRGYGVAFPLAGNNTSTNRQKNRRVEMVFSDGKGNIASRQVSIH